MNPEAVQRRRRLSRSLSRIADASVTETLAHHAASAGTSGAWRIGITGAPGVGKSTLIGRLARRRLERGDVRSLAVLAIDPTSPVSGGSILGDRVRMDAAAEDARLFIRSLASRESHDGLADNLPDLLLALEAEGFPEVIVETVGVGQVEYTIRALADTVVLALHPESGDAVQAIKAGILEMADIYVVNKADLPGAKKTAAEIGAVAARVATEPDAWRPPVVMVAQNEAAGIEALNDALDRHREWQAGRRDELAVRRARARYHAQALLARRVAELGAAAETELFDRPITDVYAELTRRLTVGLRSVDDIAE